jgi:glycosyltransferase involved in cell wall biosynthesis
MDDETLAEFAEFGQVTRLFHASPYREPDEFDWFAGDLIQWRQESAAIIDELRTVADADLWIWPTIRPQEIDACTALGVSAPMVGCVYWDPGIEARSLSAQLWRSALVHAHGTGLKLTLASVEVELRHRFMPMIPSGKFLMLPHPVDGPPLAEPKAALNRIGFFGHQRPEKGSGLIKPLLRKLVEQGYAITFQNSYLHAEVLDLPGVDLLSYAKNIAVPIAECDLVVLPYDVQKYRARGSGILVECLALGVPVIAPVGTLPGRTVEQAGVGPLFAETSLQPIYGAIRATKRNYARFSQNAHRIAHQFNKRNGVAQFASALLSVAG